MIRTGKSLPAAATLGEPPVIGPGKRSSAALLHQLDPLKDGFLASILSLNQPARGELDRDGAEWLRDDPDRQEFACRSDAR
jgi:hypothetical protein